LGFLDSLVEKGWKSNLKIEKPRSDLVADAQNVRKAAVHQRQSRFTLALQEGVRGDRGTHFHRFNDALGGFSRLAAAQETF
jgi:hypothetical protein